MNIDYGCITMNFFIIHFYKIEAKKNTESKLSQF